MHGKSGTSNSCFKRGNSSPDSTNKTQFQKNKNRRRFTACGGQVGAPHELFARPPLSPLFHLYTLAPLYLRPQSGWSPRFCYWTLVVHKASRPPDRGQATAWTLRQNAKPEEYGRGQSSGFGSTSKATLTGFEPTLQTS
jgi:hypothetical protein